MSTPTASVPAPVAHSESSRPASWRDVLFLPLRVKITLPYLLLAIVLAALATYLVTQFVLTDQEERFTARLLDSGRLTADTLVKIEDEHLALVRALAFTQGMTAAARAQDISMLNQIALPLAANANADFVALTNVNGNALVALERHSQTGEYVQVSDVPVNAWNVTQRVMNGERDDAGDKFSALVVSPRGNLLVTAGPLQENDQRVGVVLVGSWLENVARRLDRDSLANVTVYGTDGTVWATTLTTREAAQAQLDAAEYARLAQLSKDSVYIRPTRGGFGTRDFAEAFGLFLPRGGQTNGLFSVAREREDAAQTASDVQLRLVAIFAAGILAIILVGAFLANAIAKPVGALVDASQRVTSGDLTARVESRSRDELGILARTFNRMVEGLREREVIKDLFGRVVSPQVGEALMEQVNARGIQLGGEAREVTMVFTDIRDFTRLAEEQTPERVVAFLNQYFTVVARVMEAEQGLINKFGGDSTLVIFGAPTAQPDHARRAVRAALTLRDQVREFNAARVTAGEPAFRIGIGINTGTVIAGQIGSMGRFEYTVIGDAVNLTSRIEGLTREYPEFDVLLSDTTYNALEGDPPLPVRDLGNISVKGKQQQVRVYAALDDPEQTESH